MRSKLAFHVVSRVGRPSPLPLNLERLDGEVKHFLTLASSVTDKSYIALTLEIDEMGHVGHDHVKVSCQDNLVLRMVVRWT